MVIYKIWPRIWIGHMAIGTAGLILYLNARLSDPFYADSFIVLFTAIDGKQEISDQAGKYLYH